MVPFRLPSGLLLLLWIVLLLSIASSNSSLIPARKETSVSAATNWWLTLPRGGGEGAKSSSNSSGLDETATLSKRRETPTEKKKMNETETTTETCSLKERDAPFLQQTLHRDPSSSGALKKARKRPRPAATTKTVAKNQTETTLSSFDESSSVMLLGDSDFSVNTVNTIHNHQNDNDSESSLSRKRRLFLDRIAAVISDSWMRSEKDAKVRLSSTTQAESTTSSPTSNLDAVTPQTDLSLPGRHIHIVTTAALPWFTGTAVNPLLRAAHLHRRTQQINNHNHVDDSDTANNHNHENNRWVTLMIPWLELPADQQQLYHTVFDSPAHQEEYIRNWLAEQADMADVACPQTGLRILFYPARYHAGLRSIFAMGDMLQVISEQQDQDAVGLDVCILEEPEHVNWFRAPGDGWTQKFNYVVGIVHTNYKEYASSHYSGLWTAPAISIISSAMVRAYCHKVIKLSDVLQTYAPEKETTSNVHGVRSEFLKEGMRRARIGATASATTTASVVGKSLSAAASPTPTTTTTTAAAKTTNKVYFIGKLLWAKGLDIMLDLEDYYKQCTGEYFAISIYGSGPESAVIQKAFHGRRRRKTTSSSSSSRRRDSGSKKKKKHGRRKTKKKRQPQNGKQRRSQFLGTTLAIFGGSKRAAPAAALSSSSSAQQQPHNKTAPNPHRVVLDAAGGATGNTDGYGDDDDDDDSNNNYLDALPASLESFHEKAREHLARIKERIDAVDLPQTFSELRRRPIPAIFPGRVDHAELKDDHKVFVNPSVSEVLCTTTAEALAMGKFAIIPDHPSNRFFSQFPNCLAYRNKFEFVANLKWALTHEPEPLSPALARTFSWEAATDRLIAASAMTVRETLQQERLGRSRLDERIAWFHNELGKGVTGDMLRRICGAGPVSEQVRYAKKVNENNGKMTTRIDQQEDDDDDDDGAEDEDDGLSRKFRRSSFAEAIRTTLGTTLGEMGIQ